MGRLVLFLALAVPALAHGDLIGYVQSGCTNPDAGDTLTVTFPGPTTKGDVLVVAADFKYANVVSVSDPAGDAFHALPIDQTYGYGAQGWYALGIDGGRSSVTVVFSSIANNSGIFAAEYGGIDPVPPITEYPTAGAGGPAQTFPLTVSVGDQQSVLIGFGTTNGPRVNAIDPPFVGRETCFGDVFADVITVGPGVYQGTFRPSFDAGAWEAFLLQFRLYGRWVDAGVDAGARDSGTDAGGRAGSDSGESDSGPEGKIAANLGCGCGAPGGFESAGVLAALLGAWAIRRRRA